MAEYWRSSPGASSDIDGTNKPLPELRELEENDRERSARQQAVHEPNRRVQAGSERSGKRRACDDDGMNRSKRKPLLVDLNEAGAAPAGAAAEDDAIHSPPPAQPVVAAPGPVASAQRAVKRFDLNAVPEEGAEEMGEERRGMAALGLPIRVMQNLGGPTRQAAAPGRFIPCKGCRTKRPRPRVLFAPSVPPAPFPPPPEGFFAPTPRRPFEPSRLIRVAVDIRSDRSLWLTGTLWRYDIPLEIWLICCDCHSSWMTSIDFFKHAGWACIRGPEKYFKLEN